jgi:trans-2,3-dihydro-3-hydroxyanthranilate isomerase
VPFDGHPTLGTASDVQLDVLKVFVPVVTLALQVGPIRVSFEYGPQGPERLWMVQNAPVFGDLLEKQIIARALGLAVEDITFPPQVVSTGLPFIITPLASRTALRKARLTSEPEFLAQLPVQALLLFCEETVSASNHLHARVFAHQYGVPEDPATGSANGCLAAYLVQHRFFGGEEIDIRVEQGHDLGRPSLLYLRAGRQGEGIRVQVGGKVIMVAKGELVGA